MKVILAIIIALPLFVSTSFYDVRTKNSSPLLFGMADSVDSGRHLTLTYSAGRSSGAEKIARYLTMNGKQYFTLNEQGNTATSEFVSADMNPVLIGLTDHTLGHGHAGSYSGAIELHPKLESHFILIDFYERFDAFFVGIRSALGLCRSGVEIIETGSSKGAHSGLETFSHAMQNEKWSYGKMGAMKKKFGVDNLEVMLGVERSFNLSSDDDCFASGCFLVELPTGQGTKAEWVFEPRVGKNHLALGLGGNVRSVNSYGQFALSTNYRYFFGAKETRSFDTFKNGAWSRYMPVVSIPAPSGVHKSSPGINFFTRTATVLPGSQFILSSRWMKAWNDLRFELGYSFFCKQSELITDVFDHDGEFGMYDNYSNNGNTASKSKINSLKPATESGQVSISTKDLDLSSAALGVQVVSALSCKIEAVRGSYNFGFSALFEAGHSRSSYSSWNVSMHSGFIF